MPCKIYTWSAIIILFGSFTALAAAQSLTSGDITGTVTDPSGAVVNHATVTLKSKQTGAVQTHSTNAQGLYRFPLLPPGDYTVSVSAPGFQSVGQTTTVVVGQATPVNIQLAISQGATVVEVNGQGGAVQTENGNVSTAFSATQVANVPNPGNDLSYVLQAAPGAVMNTQAGYGNSSTYGLPATSNLFTINGMNENDPFLNLNNSGATNLLLGQNDVQEVTVVNNGYSAEYGGLAGANVNYVTKSGSNDFHGNLNYFWNGRVMNANSWFNDSAGVPKAFDNANQWAASLGGPLRKDKTFFFVNTEGLRVVLPTSTAVNVPSSQYQAATLANLESNDPASVPFYQQMFSLWDNAPGANGAVNSLQPGKDATGHVISGPGCGSFTGFGDTTTPCALQFRSTAGNQTNEWLLSARLDQNIGENDRAYIHFRTDHGLQATYTDPISPLFNAQSVQPQYEGQFNENHTFGSSAVNQFILSGSWYSAIFNTPNLAASTAAMPFRLRFSGGAFYDLGQYLNDWPQGRNVTQYQAIDDFSKLWGRHDFKFGVNFRRNDMTDYAPGLFTTGENTGEDLTSFFNGQGTTFIQSFATRPSQPISLYALGLYAQDEWSARPNLKLTFSLRAEHDSNPVCQTDCFARLAGDFLGASHDPGQPYNQAILTGFHEALPGLTAIDWEPRFGFAWSPFGAGTNTVLRGGIGIFNDFFPATVADNFMNNSPNYNQFVVGPAALSPADPAGIMAQAAGANEAFLNGFASGGTFASISAASPFFVPPSVYNSARYIHAPEYQEWNLEVQQGLGRKMSLSFNYVGNHGIWEPVQNAGLNGYCDASCLDQFYSPNPPLVSQFAGLPAAPLDPRFGTVTEVSSGGISNYNGMTVSFQRKFSSLELQANYTWSHALDEISNAGFLPFTFTNSNESISNPQDPFNLRKYNYGNSDYDVRHNFSLNYVWTTPRQTGWLGALTDWTLAGTIFARSGLPLTVIDSNATGILNGFNYGTSNGFNVFANSSASGVITCGPSAVATPCLTTAEFSPVLSGFGQQRRNQIYGPSYFDTDLSVLKNFNIPRWESAKLGVGFQFFNLFNHPNFDQPVGDVVDSSFGTILSNVSVPTSILGSFLGGDASPRLIQLKASLTF
jgi:Carboxypeptidase regulatory-like domain